VGGVEDDAGDIDQAGVVKLVQQGLVQSAPDTGPRPSQERRWAVDFDIPKQGGSWRQA
jgi:hypothetical protein